MLKINLIPPDYRKEIEFSKDNRHQILNLALSLVVLGICLGVLFLGSIFFKTEINKTQDLISNIKPSLKALAATETKATALTSRIANLSTLMNTHLYWKNAYDEIMAAKPATVSFDQITLDSDLKKEQQILGLSPDIETVAVLRDKLESSSLIKEVRINSASYVKEASRTGYDFKVTFSFEKNAFVSAINGAKS